MRRWYDSTCNLSKLYLGILISSQKNIMIVRMNLFGLRVLFLYKNKTQRPQMQENSDFEAPFSEVFDSYITDEMLYLLWLFWKTRTSTLMMHDNITHLLFICWLLAWFYQFLVLFMEYMPKAQTAGNIWYKVFTHLVLLKRFKM